MRWLDPFRSNKATVTDQRDDYLAPEPEPELETVINPSILKEYCNIRGAGMAHLVDSETHKAFVRIRAYSTVDLTLRETKWLHEFLGDVIKEYEDVAVPEET